MKMKEEDIKVGSDAKEPVSYGTTSFAKRNPSHKIPEFVREAWSTFHKYGMWLTLALGLGIYIGVVASGRFYSTKMDEITLVGGMVHKQKVFTVTPR
jgi:hypothetical protein